MAGSVIDRLKSAWNAFKNVDDFTWQDDSRDDTSYGVFMSSGARPDRVRFTRGNEQSIVNAVYNRIAMDVASINIKHVKLDESERYESTVDSGLNRCLNLSANVDQTGRAFVQDAVASMLDDGSVALVPTDTSDNPNLTSSYDIYSMRAGKIVSWYPDAVRVDLYNERTGRHEEIKILKKNCAIIENPFYAVMNEPNSTLRRLIRKLNILDVIDEQTASGKFNMIVQLPYAVRGDKRKLQAEDRRRQLEKQLGSGNKYGVAYIDSAEKITQLNRPLDNNLLTQVEYLTNMLYSQLGMTSAVMDGTADEQAMLNYNNRTIEPIVSAIVNELKRKFLTKTAIAQHQSIMFFMDPFRLVPINNIAEIADKFTRNEILTSNEVRQIIGFAPSKDPKADELTNSNIKSPNGQTQGVFPNANEVSGSESSELLNKVKPNASAENSDESQTLLNKIRSKSEEVNRQNG